MKTRNPAAAPEEIKFAVVGADRLMRDFVRQAMPAADPRFACVAEMACTSETVAICASHQPALIIFDLNERGSVELTALRNLALTSDWALLIITSGAPDPLLQELVARKGCGFFSRANSLEALARAAFLVVTGGIYFDGPFQSLIRPNVASPQPVHLSQRERHVLQLIGEGHSTKEVATILGLSVKTVDHYRTALMQKLDVHDVVKLTHCAIRMGLVRV